VREEREGHVGQHGKERRKKICWGPRITITFSYLFKKNSNEFELIRSNDRLPVLENFQIKYGIVENEIRNNFPYWNVSKFRIEFELK
jgi:hypothetical protein